MDRVVAITGGARGIGRATAERLARDGARVAIGDRDTAAAEATAAALGVSAHPLDVTDPVSFAAFLDAVEAQHGPLDVLVNNAGIMPVGPLREEPAEAARAAFDVNVLGVLTGMKLALERMLPRGRGHVVNLASYAGKLPVPGQVTYAASKAAVIALTEGASWEHRTSGVAFTAILPSFTATDLIAGTGTVRTAEPIEPAEVADAIAAALAGTPATVYVPGKVRYVDAAVRILPRRAREAIHRRLGTDRAFMDLDHAARRAYSARIGTG